MENKVKPILKIEEDDQASLRKNDHIEMAFKSDAGSIKSDARFFYEPMLSPHPKSLENLSVDISGKTMNFPIWISSMTGGTEKANQINHNLAKLCGELGLGMGLGSCRQLLYEDRRLSEFDVRSKLKDQPLYINLGIAQVEELLEKKETNRIDSLISKLSADGLIIHINPFQEWLQPEGDRFNKSPIETVRSLMEEAIYPIIVKEVGQGFGKESLNELLRLPLEAIDLAGYGGTNFSMLELLRSDKVKYAAYSNMAAIGHTCEEMIAFINEFYSEHEREVKAKKIIVSGGVRNFLDGFYHTKKCNMPALYAHASAFLKYALNYDDLKTYTQYQIEGLKMANAFLRVK